MQKRVINFALEDEALQEIIMATDEALETVITELSSEKGESGTVTLKITLGKNVFEDGYKRLRKGISINYKVDSSITNKSSFSSIIPTENMMLQESDEFGYHLVTAPDPQMTLDDYLGNTEE